MEANGQHHTPATLSPRKYPGTPLNGWLCWPPEAVWAVLQKNKIFCLSHHSKPRPSSP